jgi:serine protease Do
MAPGAKTNVVVMRAGKEKTFDIEVGKLDEGQQVAQNEEKGEEEGPVVFGLRVQDLGPELAEQLGVAGEKGVVITDIENGSPGAEAGLRRGDVILEVNQKAVANVAEFRGAMSTQDKALLLVRRGEATLFVAVKKKAEK